MNSDITNSNINILNTNNNTHNNNCLHINYSLLEEHNEIENDSIKCIETYICENCQIMGYLIYYVPNEITWIYYDINDI